MIEEEIYKEFLEKNKLIFREYVYLSDAVAPLTETHKTRDDDGGGDGGEDEAQHEAHGPGEAEEEVGEHRHGGGLHEAGDEGGAHHHSGEFPQLHRVQLHAGSGGRGEADGEKVRLGKTA